MGKAEVILDGDIKAGIGTGVFLGHPWGSGDPDQSEIELEIPGGVRVPIRFNAYQKMPPFAFTFIADKWPK